MRRNTYKLFYNFKTALYSSVLVVNDLIVVESCFKQKIVNVKLKAGLLLNASLRIRPLTFINEGLCLSGSPFVVNTAPP